MDCGIRGKLKTFKKYNHKYLNVNSFIVKYDQMFLSSFIL